MCVVYYCPNEDGSTGWVSQFSVEVVTDTDTLVTKLGRRLGAFKAYRNKVNVEVRPDIDYMDPGAEI